MPVKSYLALSHKGKKEQLQEALNKMPGCECAVSDNKDVLLLITETDTDADDKQLFLTINQLENLQLLTLVSAFSNDTSLTY